MAPPVNTALQAPTGFKMGDGWQTLVAFARNPSVGFWEKTTKPVGFDGGDMVDTTTLRNNVWRTRSPRHLKTLTELVLVGAWDPDFYTTLLSLINAQGSISIWYPDRTSVDFYGFLQKFDPDAHEEGKMPEATMTITPTNWDPINQVEAAPVITPAPGT